jgi:lipopolysaccharide exporter
MRGCLIYFTAVTERSRRGIMGIWQAGFSRHVAGLATGTLIGQVIGLFSNPLMSRLYGPEACGILAAFNSILGIIVPSVCLRFEFALMLSLSVRVKHDIIFLCGLLTLCVASMTFCGMLFVSSVKGLDVLDAVGSARWFLPFGVLVGGVSAIATSWCGALTKFDTLARGRIILSLMVAFLTLGFGLVFSVSGPLLIGASQLAQFIAVAWIVISVQRSGGWPKRKEFKFSRLVEALKEQRHFPLYNLPMTLLDQVTAGLPIVLFASYYGLQAIACYSQCFIILRIPASLIGSAVAQVFFQRAGQIAQDRVALRALTLKCVCVLSLGAFFLIIGTFLIGDPFVYFFYGPVWSPVGTYLKILVFSSAMVLITSAISTLPSVMGCQRGHLVVTVIAVILRSGATFLGIQSGSLYTAATILVLAEVIGSGLFLGWLWMVLNRKESTR